MKKIVNYFILGIITIFLIGCTDKKNPSDDIVIFDMLKAKEVAIDYVENLSKGNMEEAIKSCTKELSSVANFDQFNDLRISGYKIIDDLEGADYLILTMDVSRTRENYVRSDLDRFNIKVIDTEDGYKINEVKAEGRGEVFEENEKLKIIKLEEGKTKLLLRKKDVPKDIYPKGEGIILNKEKVPEGKFKTVTLGFDMNSVAFTLVNEKSTLVGIATIQDVKETVGAGDGQGEGSGQNQTNDSGINSEDLIEKPIADKVNGYDLIHGGNVEKMIFTQDDGQLIVEYSEEDKGKFIRIYSNPNGGLIPLDLEKNFKRGEYSVEVDEVKKDEVIINVSSLSENREKDGQYIIDIKKETVIKKEK